MRIINWIILVVLIVIAITCVIVALVSDKKESSKQLNETAKSIFLLILSGFWLTSWLFVQWFVGSVLKEFQVDELDNLFLIIFRILFATLTLALVLIKVVKDVIVEFKAAKKIIKEK